MVIKVNQRTFVSFQYVLNYLGMESKRDVLVSGLQRIITFRNTKIIYTALHLTNTYDQNYEIHTFFLLPQFLG